VIFDIEKKNVTFDKINPINMELFRVLQSLESHTIYYWIVIALIGFAISQSLLVGIRFYFKKENEPRSYLFFALLILAFGFTQLHFLLRILGLFELYPRIRFLPIYFTLALPVLFFYYIKIALFPTYQFRWTDAKHFLLPIGQVMYFFITFLGYHSGLLPKISPDTNPFFGSLETAAYLGQFFAYLFFSLRYIKVKKKSSRSIQKRRQTVYLEILVHLFSLLFIIHTLFIFSDFYSYRIAYINMQTTKLYVGLGVLTFTSLLFCLSMYGMQLILWGKKRIYPN
jgi:phosphate/sulfate permease